MSILKSLDKNKIQINRGNPIKMNLFLTFLTVPVVKNTNHPGHDTGWTQYKGDNDLIIGGGILSSGEYLNDIQFKKNLDNPYNNYVNPFALFDILTEEGKRFFIEYYREDIEKIKRDELIKLDNLRKKIAESEKNIEEIDNLLD
jgi:hypothetical protein